MLQSRQIITLKIFNCVKGEKNFVLGQTADLSMLNCDTTTFCLTSPAEPMLKCHTIVHYFFKIKYKLYNIKYTLQNVSKHLTHIL